MKQKILFLTIFLGLTFAFTSCGSGDDDEPTNTTTDISTDYGTIKKDEFVATGGFKDLKPFSATVLCSVNSNFSGTYLGVGVEIVPNSADFTSQFCERISGSGITNNHFEVYLKNGDEGLLEANTTYYYRSYANMAGVVYYGETRSLTTPDLNIQEEGTVDLGLSVKWAAANMGAATAEKLGDYHPMVKYYGTDGVINTWGNGGDPVITYTDGTQESICMANDIPYEWSGNKDWDIVARKLGGKWRTPKEYEWDELINGCKWAQTTYKGIKGWAASKKDGSVSIFFPLYSPKKIMSKHLGGYDNTYNWDKDCTLYGASFTNHQYVFSLYYQHIEVILSGDSKKAVKLMAELATEISRTSSVVFKNNTSPEVSDAAEGLWYFYSYGYAFQFRPIQDK